MSERLFRKKRRYIVIEGSRDTQVFEALRDVFQRLYGVVGLAESGLRKIDVKGCLAVSCYKEWVPKVVLAVSLVREAAGHITALKTVKVSGTIKSLAEELD
jgi:RNase P/RNase MRP subunit POP5